MTCLACRDRRHGPDCEGCPCTCRAVLGLAGPFESPDPTAPDLVDLMRRVA